MTGCEKPDSVYLNGGMSFSIDVPGLNIDVLDPGIFLKINPQDLLLLRKFANKMKSSKRKLGNSQILEQGEILGLTTKRPRDK